MRYGVSVYMCNWNNASVLGAAIYSAVRETPAEVFVIDDASTDGSLELLYAAERAYGVSFVQHQRKSQCHVLAARPHILSLRGQHIVGMGADDELCPGICLAPMRHPQAAVVFHAYAVRRPGQPPHAVVPAFVDCETVLTAEQVCQRHLGETMPMETGIGSAMRHDWQRWLIEHEYERMGPLSDCIGFATVAALAGAVYVPHIGAIFTESAASYGSVERSGERSAQYHDEVRAFLKGSGIDLEVAAAICHKRAIQWR